ncbi:MAG: sodium:solute symporter [Planctomycetota bacterium]
MNMSSLDWGITIVLFIVLTAMARFTKKYTTSVADFLAANRCAGRYLVCIAYGMAALGAVSVVAQMQISYETGFAASWWNLLTFPIMMVLTLSGWIVYRYRATRAMTLAQFFEIRYSRRFRVFTGILAFGAGIVNFGIFPAIGANFFIRYCGMPDSIGAIPTFPLVVCVLLGVSVYFTVAGGQIAVIVTDFLQGMFCNLVLVAILVVLLVKFNINEVFETLITSPPGKSMVNPFDLESNKGFTVWFFVIHIVISIYQYKSWQAEQGYSCAAASPHEAKMAGVLSHFRHWGFWGCLALLPLCAYTVMHSPSYADQAVHVQNLLEQIPNEEVRNQMITPVAMATFLPSGLIGLFAAAMFAAFVSTHNTQLHSWGSIFIQDVIMPFRKKPIPPDVHLKWLRWSVLSVAVFIFFWSCVFRQTQRIQLFFMVTGAIFMGGAGSVLVGGLYWKRGTTAAAWAAMIVGSTLAVSAVIVEQFWYSLYGQNFPIDFKWMTAASMISSIISYILVSLLGRSQSFDMDRMLHRGKYAVAGGDIPETMPKQKLGSRIKMVLGYTKEFTFGDKLIYAISIGKTLLFFGIGITAALIAAFGGLSDPGWARVHYYMLWFTIITSFAIAVWLTIGGFRDLKRLFDSLKTVKRNDLDDGRVVDHHNLADEMKKQ